MSAAQPISIPVALVPTLYSTMQGPGLSACRLQAPSLPLGRKPLRDGSRALRMREEAQQEDHVPFGRTTLLGAAAAATLLLQVRVLLGIAFACLPCLRRHSHTEQCVQLKGLVAARNCPAPPPPARRCRQWRRRQRLWRCLLHRLLKSRLRGYRMQHHASS